MKLSTLRKAAKNGGVIKFSELAEVLSSPTKKEGSDDNSMEDDSKMLVISEENPSVVIPGSESSADAAVKGKDVESSIAPSNLQNDAEAAGAGPMEDDAKISPGRSDENHVSDNGPSSETVASTTATDASNQQNSTGETNMESSSAAVTSSTDQNAASELKSTYGAFSNASEIIHDDQSKSKSAIISQNINASASSSLAEDLASMLEDAESDSPSANGTQTLVLARLVRTMLSTNDFRTFLDHIENEKTPPFPPYGKKGPSFERRRHPFRHRNHSNVSSNENSANNDKDEKKVNTSSGSLSTPSASATSSTTLPASSSSSSTPSASTSSSSTPSTSTSSSSTPSASTSTGVISLIPSSVCIPSLTSGSSSKSAAVVAASSEPDTSSKSSPVVAVERETSMENTSTDDLVPPPLVADMSIVSDASAVSYSSLGDDDTPMSTSSSNSS